MRRIDPQFWKGRRVFVTGHMGFKCAWRCSLLARLGALSIGFGKDDRQKLLYRGLDFPGHVHTTGDINDLPALEGALARSGSEILIHLAAQPLVLASYADPVGTFDTNVLGTAKVLAAARNVPSLRAIVAITTDKVYRNHEWSWAYRESDALGGADPYSASKAAAEIVVSSMAESFFSANGAAGVATARAGNVIGGGDWADNRLLPDAARALGRGEPLICRNPGSVRPWQHVLDPLAGYLLLAETLAAKPAGLPSAWNFGPTQDDTLTVGDVADIFVRGWADGASWTAAPGVPAAKEARHLAIDSALARDKLGWRPRWRAGEAVERTARWFRAHHAGAQARELVDRDISDFMERDGTLG